MSALATQGYVRHLAHSRGWVFWFAALVRLGVCVAALVLWWPIAAKADQQDDVDRIVAHVGRASAFHLGPRPLEQGEVLPLLLPSRVVSARTPGCVHVIVIGAQSVHFTCDLGESGDGSSDTTASRAGLLELVRCGDDRKDLTDASITMLSLRGPIDAVVFSTGSADPVSSSLLPNRAIGVEAAERTLSRASELPRLGAWLQQLESSAALQGATRSERRLLPVLDKSAGESLIGFDPGCHEIHLLADIDWESVDGSNLGVELTWEDTGELAARDTLDSRAPALRVCTAQPRTAQLRFPALPQSVAALVVRAHFEWPGGIPSTWADNVRNRVAQVLLQKHLRMLSSPPVKAWMGGATAVALHVPLAGRACYLAVLAASTNAAALISLEVLSGLHWATDSSLDDPTASVSFCLDRGDGATFKIDARDANATWILGLWSVAALPREPDFR